MKRRTFLKASVTGAAIGAVAAPNVLKAAETFKWKMTTSFPPGLPFYQSGRNRHVRLSPNRRHSLADVRYRADFVRFTPNKRHSGRGWECLKLTHKRHFDGL